MFIIYSIATSLWLDFLHHNPANPDWFNRDRFVLSNGHGSMLLYSLLHLSGYDVSLSDIKNFRQINSKLPGHPESHITPGVEATTGPLGQGLANAVGMAIAERVLASTYNKKEFNIIDHHTYVFAGDGCLMEGISHEASSLAATLKLGKLIVFWDDNGISIDGHCSDWFNENVAHRYKAYGWHVITDVDGHDNQQIHDAIAAAKSNHELPSLICCKTTIGFGADDLAATAKVHGAPLGDQAIKKLRENLNWHYAEFIIPKNIKDSWSAVDEGKKIEQRWQQLYGEYKLKYPGLAQDLDARINKKFSDNWPQQVSAFIEDINEEKDMIATRKASQKCIDFLLDKVPGFFGGSADLSCSNLTESKAAIALKDSFINANYLHYGVREFAMFAISNGLALHGGFIPFCGTFLTFVDYGRNALRLAAMSKLQVIYVLTHDSIGLGEDGPTHQPVEHAAMLRATPGVNVWRPCDSVETAAAWQHCVQHIDGPSCLLLSRQKLQQIQRSDSAIENISRGGYVIYQPGTNWDGLIIATGSEVYLALEAATSLNENGFAIAVVSMPCLEVFLAQEKSYQEAVLPSHIGARLAVEALSSQSWYQLVGRHGAVIGMNEYGQSGTATELFNFYGFSIDRIKIEMKKLFHDPQGTDIGINKGEKSYAN